jgi:hypothetical protein
MLECNCCDDIVEDLERRHLAISISPTLADLADRRMPPVLDAYKRKPPVGPKHIDDTI